MLTRIARSHVRVGTFEYAANEDARRNQGPVLTKALADHCIDRLYPEFAGQPDAYLAFYSQVVARQARLVAQWMQVGFIHGVMNTDNMSISGETIDFGPCAFMDGFKPAAGIPRSTPTGATPSTARRRSPRGTWPGWRNACCLCSTPTRPWLWAAPAKCWTRSSPPMARLWPQGLERKLGLKPRDPANEPFIAGLWRLLDDSNADFTLFFRRLTRVAGGADPSDFLELFAPAEAATREEAARFLNDWRGLTAGDDFSARVKLMREANPIVIPRNANGYSEGIALDVNGYLSEGSGENLFIVRNGTLYTTPLADSILSGITRDSVITLAKEMGYTVVEQSLPRELIYIADEVFFTGTAAEVTPIRSVDRILVKDGNTGPITQQLAAEFFGITSGKRPDRYGWLTPVKVKTVETVPA